MQVGIGYMTKQSIQGEMATELSMIKMIHMILYHLPTYPNIFLSLLPICDVFLTIELYYFLSLVTILFIYLLINND